MDGSNEIDKTEAVKHWKTKFGQISAHEFFNAVDINHNGLIDFAEFLSFWEVVKGSGHDDKEIMMELDNIKKGESWCGFNDLPEMY